MARARERQAALIAALSREDRRILELRFEEGMKIRQIATVLGLEPRRLYRRLRRCLAGLRRGLEAEGIARDVATEARFGR